MNSPELSSWRQQTRINCWFLWVGIPGLAWEVVVTCSVSWGHCWLQRLTSGQISKLACACWWPHLPAVAGQTWPLLPSWTCLETAWVSAWWDTWLSLEHRAAVLCNPVLEVTCYHFWPTQLVTQTTWCSVVVYCTSGPPMGCFLLSLVMHKVTNCRGARL